MRTGLDWIGLLIDSNKEKRRKISTRKWVVADNGPRPPEERS